MDKIKDYLQKDILNYQPRLIEFKLNDDSNYIGYIDGVEMNCEIFSVIVNLGKDGPVTLYRNNKVFVDKNDNIVGKV